MDEKHKNVLQVYNEKVTLERSLLKSSKTKKINILEYLYYNYVTIHYYSMTYSGIQII